MRSSTPGMLAFLRTATVIWSADLFTITLLNDSVYRWTSADQNVTVDGVTWLAVGPRISRSKWSANNSVTVPEMDLTLMALSTELIEGSPAIPYIQRGGFDGARVRLERALSDTPGNTANGSILLFEGRMSTISGIGATQLTMKIKGDNVLLDQDMPRNLFQSGCIKSLYSPPCTLIQSNFTFEYNAGTGATTTFVQWGTVAPTDAVKPRLQQGAITFTSGLNNGVQRTVQYTAVNGFTLSYPLPSIPGVGDTFVISYGCDKTFTTCVAFANAENWRGYPNIPPAETGF